MCYILTSSLALSIESLHYDIKDGKLTHTKSQVCLELH